MKALVSAADVRSWAAPRADQFSADAQATIDNRGRVHPEIRQAYNAANKGAPYVEAAHARKSTVVPLKRTQGGKVRSVKTPVQTRVVRGLARDLGITHGTERGRFSTAHLDAVGAALLDVDLKLVNSL